MIVKKHITQDQRLILTICDDKLIGEVFTEGEKQLDLSSDFYKGEQKQDEEIVKLLKKAYSINAVGEESVKLCVDNGFIKKEDVCKVDSILFAQMVN